MKQMLIALTCMVMAVPALAEPDLSGFRSDARKVPVTPVPRPGLHETITDPDFGARITRITDISQVKGVQRLRHYYSKRNPFNADGTRAVIMASDGSNWLYDAHSWTPIKQLPLRSSDAEVHWHPSDPDRIFLVDFGTDYNISRMFWLTPSSGDKKLLLDMEQFGFVTAYGLMEGNPDKAMTVYAVAGKTKGGGMAMALVDLVNARVIVQKAVEPGWVDDWISVSPSGDYVVTMGKGYSRIFDRNLKLLHTLPEGSYGHGDLCQAADGREALVFDGADLQLNGDRNINIAWLETGKLEIGTRIGWRATPHVSCRNLDFPGWALISTQGSDHWRHDYPNRDFEIFWLKLDGSGEVRRLAHHHSSRERGGYFAEQHAVTNRDGTRIIFSSNWDGDQINDYLISLPGK